MRNSLHFSAFITLTTIPATFALLYALFMPFYVPYMNILTICVHISTVLLTLAALPIIYLDWPPGACLGVVALLIMVLVVYFSNHLLSLRMTPVHLLPYDAESKSFLWPREAEPPRFLCRRPQYPPEWNRMEQSIPVLGCRVLPMLLLLLLRLLHDTVRTG